MDNNSFWSLNREWRQQEIRYCSEFSEFIKKKYPRVYKFLNTQDSIGHFPLTPYTYDMKVILKDWQAIHGFFECEVKRVVRRKNELSLISE